MSIRSRIDKIIYKITKKPSLYKEVKNPPKTVLSKLLHPQVARQVQYNNWSKSHRIYSGSYLPKDDRCLTQQGWENKKHLQNGGKVIQRKSTGQTVRSETHGQQHRYHWLDFWEKSFTNSEYKKFKNKEFSGQNVYYNKYGELTHKGDPEHHLYGDEND